MRFVAVILLGFRTCLKLDAILAREKLHRVAATKIACVNGPLVSKLWMKGAEKNTVIFEKIKTFIIVQVIVRDY